MLLRVFLLLPSCALAELVFLLSIFRHGDRAPYFLPYPNDRNGEGAWPRGGWGQLTNIGVTQASGLGKFYRQRYAGRLFDTQFNKSEVFIRSSDLERALESAQAMASTLFAPQGEFLWDQNLHWQPTPIHATGVGEPDLLLKPTDVSCPAYDATAAKQNEQLLKTINDDYRELFTKLTNYTGTEVNFGTVKPIYDVTREIIHNLTQPDWVYEKWNGKQIVDHLRELWRLKRTSEFDTVEKAKYRGGYLLNDWLAKIESVLNGTETRKAIFYSSHDGTLAALMYALGIHNGLLVPYASSLMMEVHRDGDKYHTEFFYRNQTTTNEVHALQMPNCGTNCPVEDLLRILEPMRVRSVQEFTKLCDPSTLSSSSGANTFYTVLVALLFITLKY